MAQKARFHPLIVGGLILIVSETLALVLASREKDLMEASQITPPEVSVGWPVIYFFVAAGVMGVILFVISRRVLRIILKAFFVLLFAWGTFVALSLLSVPAAPAISVLAALARLFVPRVWLHNLLMVIALASIGVVFGAFFAPWTAILLMLIISVYDVLAVRFGYMVWMVNRLSDLAPACVIPRTIAGWNSDLRGVAFFEDRSEKEFSILGGGDIGFPLLLTVSVYLAHGFAGSVVVAAFALLGLAAAYWMQQKPLRGKPTPALPPITLLCIVGYVIVYLS